MSVLPLWERLPQLLDAGRVDARGSIGCLQWVRGRLAQHPATLVMTDRSRAGGALGVEECLELQQVLRQAGNDGQAVVLVLDSGGARLDQGLAALGAFRRLFSEALAAWQAGVRLLAVVYGNCFGGASLLACLCQERIGVPGARFGLSGPSIIEALGGKTELDSADRHAVDRLFGVEARRTAGILTRLCEDDGEALHAALRAACRAGRTEDLRQRHARLLARLLDAGQSLPSSPVHWTGFRRGPVHASDCWLAADWLLRRPPPGYLTVALDAPGQAADRREEHVGLSEFVVHLAQCLLQLRAQGAAVTLLIEGQAGGAIYVALAASASKVLARDGASVHLLPPQAVSRVLRTTAPAEGLALAREYGVVDEVVAA